MAIEASKQIADGSRTISGFRLQDISFKKALHVPDTVDGVEYILSMREVAETNFDRSPYWSEFRVSSSSADGEDWTEHCSGLIMVDYDAAIGEVDNGREAAAEAKANADMLVVAESICQNRVGLKDTYEDWKEIGMAFGPNFTNVSDILLGDGRGNALSTVTIPNVAKCMPKHFLRPHLIQPATLDCILQTFMMAILDAKKSERLRQPELPTYMKAVWVSASISNEPGCKFRCYSQAEQISPTQYRAGTTAWDAKTRQVKLRIAGIETKPLQVDAADAADATDHLCSFVEWQPDVGLLSKRSTVFQNMLSGTLFDLEAHRAHLKRCQLLSMFYIAKALEAVENIDISGLKVHHGKYLDWIRHQAARISKPGSLPHQDPAALESLLWNEDERQCFFRAVHEPSAREELMHRLGPQIKPIICGEVDALEVMFTSGDFMDRFYAESSVLGNIKPLLKSYLEALSQNSTNLRVIEIGAGTGGTTMPVLETLSPKPSSSLGDDSETSSSRVAQYTYTDVSAGFFKQAKEKFGHWGSLMEYRILDIESSPAEQGFEVGSFDLVVASNVSPLKVISQLFELIFVFTKVLHATSCLANTLANARSLLKRLVNLQGKVV
jgi:SAM-dependent methyltransferase